MKKHLNYFLRGLGGMLILILLCLVCYILILVMMVGSFWMFAGGKVLPQEIIVQIRVIPVTLFFSMLTYLMGTTMEGSE